MLVPHVVRCCVEEVERRGMDEVGIYRISGTTSEIGMLKAAFDSSKEAHSRFPVGMCCYVVYKLLETDQYELQYKLIIIKHVTQLLSNIASPNLFLTGGVVFIRVPHGSFFFCRLTVHRFQPQIVLLSGVFNCFYPRF